MNEQLARRPVIAVQHSPDSVPERLAPVTAAAEVRLVESDRLATALPGAEVLFVYDFRSSALRETWSAADSLRWVQIASTGVDPVLFDEFVASDVVLTNSRGIFERPIAEYVLAQILAFAKDIRRSTRAQAALSWRHFESESIEGHSGRSTRHRTDRSGDLHPPRGSRHASNSAWASRICRLVFACR